MKDLTLLTDYELKEYYSLAVDEWCVAKEEADLWDNECEDIQREFYKRNIQYDL